MTSELFIIHDGGTSIDMLLQHLSFNHGTVLPDGVMPQIILQWGADRYRADDVDGAWLLNEGEAVRRSGRKRQVQQLLHMHGIEFKPPGDHTDVLTNVYNIPVFHLEALAVFKQERNLLPGLLQKKKNTFEETAYPPKTWHEMRAARLAVRTVYLLGLDFALMKIGLTTKGVLNVLEADTDPPLNRRLAQLYGQAIARFQNDILYKRNVEKRMMLGADLEFILMNREGKVTSASSFMNKNGEVGCDAVIMRAHRLIYPLVELRPKPSTHVKGLLLNIIHAMRKAEGIIGQRNFVWLAGGMPKKGFKLGGHIHFSGIALSSRLLRVLDNYLALPLMMIEPESSLERRPRYGALGDFRLKSHGGFEYRTLPSWIVSPRIALAVLTLARFAAENSRSLFLRPLDHADVQHGFYRGDKKRLYPIVNRLWQDIKKLSGYRAAAKQLEVLEKMTHTGQTWNESEDFRKQWRLGLGCVDFSPAQKQKGSF